MEQVSGGCLCGKVRIVARGLPYRVGLCHCLDCRKHHGALFHASAIYPKMRLRSRARLTLMVDVTSARAADPRPSSGAEMKWR